MVRKLILEFTKMHGAGNDFIVIDNRWYNFPEEQLAVLAQRLCKRRLGVGADGLLALCTPDDEQFDFKMRFLNSDGSNGRMCGNGARCIAQFAYRTGMKHHPLVFETDGGIYQAIVEENPELPVKLMMPDYERYVPAVTLAQPPETLPSEIDFMLCGTHHATCFVENINETPVVEWGKQIREDTTFKPHGVNVNFIEVKPKTNDTTACLNVRTFEKGVEEETLACGTGALASASVAYLKGAIQETTVEVQMKGGCLTVGFEVIEGKLTQFYQFGPTVIVYRGSLEV